MDTKNRTADELEIRNLLARLLWEADNAGIDDLDTYVSCFTEDAEWEMFGDVRRGHEDLRHGAEERRRTGMMGPGTTVFHFLACTEVSFEGDQKATARSYIQAYRNGPHDPELFLMGQYHDVVRRTETGWKLAKRVVVF
jgi:3-phenylpropionate/cinnamic acid dioxygenase small subunit